ncbi:peptide/nickel transport system ATP-binding protein [Agromyces sp. CF514]|uniref:dipeptide ABC transporter ATP-binding protein n=1 Tax=Agromyces sp. CF514 TaxID=1881031 RepID=UPI0008F3599A|nr:ABC transporter ATP-binding protein [Agromyces sp. CF514]SFR69485.1 peptide/nickel transport system ATP-binding protein [Agromyces sp. CF514]
MSAASAVPEHPPATPRTPLLEISNLAVSYRTASGTIEAVRDASLTVHAGETVAIVGESGSGKSTTAHAVVQLLPSSASIARGSVRFEGRDVTKISRVELRGLRGRAIGFVPQDPTVSLNPVQRIGRQVAEVLEIHGLADRRTAAAQAIDALAEAGLPDPERQAQQYPHELSGGMRQRVLIAIALIARPALVIADEPTSALDVTVQRQILDRIDRLKHDLGTAVLLITHDLGVAADRADRIVVMSQGEVVEQGTPAEVLGAPTHPYTRALIAAAPSLDLDAPFAEQVRVTDAAGPADAAGATDAAGQALAAASAPLVVAHDLVKEFPVPRAAGGGVHRAVDGVSFAIPRGRTLALVGESGSGKSTTARLVLRLAEATSGSVEFDGVDLSALGSGAVRRFRRRAQLVHQNPYASLNPRLPIGRIVSDPLEAFGVGSRAERRRRVEELLDVVALPAGTIDRKPAELSGGQRQRVAIARALALAPDLVVLDEPVSALDVSIQDQILTLLTEIQGEFGVSYLFISHDLAVVRRIAHDVIVLRDGRVVEAGETSRLFRDPREAYTQELLDAIPGRATRG